MESVTTSIDAAVLYLYGIVPKRQNALEMEGVEPGSGVFFVESGDLACAASLVPARDYQQLPANESAERADWVACRAWRHHEVLQRLHATGTVLPLKFGALCPTVEEARMLLADLSGAITELLERFHGKDEWTLNISIDEERMNALLQSTVPELLALKADASGPSDGLAYFARKKLQRATADLIGARTLEVEDDVQDRLTALGFEARPGRGGALSLLVERHAFRTLERTLADLEATHAQLGLAFELVGPWPPYSFSTTIG